FTGRFRFGGDGRTLFNRSRFLFSRHRLLGGWFFFRRRARRGFLLSGGGHHKSRLSADQQADQKPGSRKNRFHGPNGANGRDAYARLLQPTRQARSVTPYPRYSPPAISWQSWVASMPSVINARSASRFHGIPQLSRIQ